MNTRRREAFVRICVVGTGYVGLVTGTCFSEFGVDVTCVDANEEKIRILNQGGVPIYEPGLDTMIARNVKEGRLSFTTDLKSAVERSLIVFIAVGTPPKADGSADLQYIEQVARSIAGWMNGYKVVVNKSTAPVGTGRWIRDTILKHQKEPHRFSVCSNPEFLREGSAIEDFVRPDRVVIGSEDAEAIAIMKDLYSPLYLIETPIVITSLETAELIKYASNAFLAVKISFINDLSVLCDKVGADVHHVAKAMGLDRRIGPKFLHPGPGYGGSCFPKDTLALIDTAKKAGTDLRIVQAAVEVNSRQREAAFQKIKRLTGGLAGKTVAILGLSFKPNTDDMRDAPSIPIIEKLLKEGAEVRAYDPVAMTEAKKVLSGVTFCGDAYDAARGADCLVFMTEWNQFRNLNTDKLKEVMRTHAIADLRNIYEPKKMRELGFQYAAMGR
jgi:UDPglucose 6-dehydrogenase